MYISVLVADSQRLYAEAVAAALGTREGIRALPESPVDGPTTLATALRLHPDVVVVDHLIGGRLDGPAVAWELRSDLPTVKVVTTSWVVAAAQVDAALGAGAVGLLPKSIGIEDLAVAVRQAHAGESPVFGDQLRRLVETVESRNDVVEERTRRFATLSQRESELLGMLEQGHSSQKLAAALFINEGTLRNHIHSILKKTGARNQQELVQMARKGAVQLVGSGPPSGTWRPVNAGTLGPRVLVADEQRLFAEALGHALTAAPGQVVQAAEYGSGSAAIQAVIKTRPDVVVYDYWMPETTGPAAARYLATWAPGAKVVLLSWLHGPSEVAKAHRAGAAGVVRKSIRLDGLVQTIDEAATGRRLTLAEAPRGVVPGQPDLASEGVWQILVTLTPREVEVLQLLSRGRSRNELAEELGISSATARNHLNNILRKTATSSGHEAVGLVRRAGLVREPGAPPLS